MQLSSHLKVNESRMNAGKVIIKSINKHSDKHDGLVCGLSIPFTLLTSWSTEAGSSYVEQLNEAITGHALQIICPCERVEGRLRRKSGEVAGKTVQLSYFKRMKHLEKYYDLQV